MFLLTLIVVSIITVRISDAILDSKVGALDRTLGFMFGAARGVLLCVVAFLFFNWLVPEKTQPEWVREAKTRPFLQSTGDQLMAMLPEDPLNTLQQRVNRRLREGEPPPETEAAPAPAQPARPPPLSRGEAAARRIAPNGAGICL